MPSSLCRWSIHCRPVHYVPIPSPPHSPTEQFDLDDEESWQPWPRSHKSKEYTEKLIDNLENNDFSSVQVADLPIAADHVSRAARHSPKELLVEALGFSIMSRNVDLMEDLMPKVRVQKSDVTGLYPFHLAVAYLDGSKTCCNVLDVLARNYSIRKFYLNDLGHTVLDQLMMTILKAHTSCVPSVVDVIFKKEKRFEGEDVDVCGRWDADSDGVRQLLANGRSAIPFEWKHMFCHTSIQSICHCIAIICHADLNEADLINNPSGLFLRHCLYCGLKLQLLPLHTLILVGFHLSRSGCEDETLFGILACLLSLLNHGANLLLKANISVQDLMGEDQGNDCTHEELNPAELAGKASKLTWSKNINTAWQVISNVLSHSQAEWNVNSSKRCSSSSDNEMNTDETDTSNEDKMSTDEQAGYEDSFPGFCHDCRVENFFGASKSLASLWAAVQTELLTYRRLEEGDEWISRNFDMYTLNKGLINKGEVDIALLQSKMVKPYCDCGLFPPTRMESLTIVEDVGAYYFSNLDDWNRTTYIHVPTGEY